MKQSLKKTASGEPLGDEVWAKRTLSFEAAVRLLLSRFIEGQKQYGAPHQICSLRPCNRNLIELIG
jgi:hypothetical protein